MGDHGQMSGATGALAVLGRRRRVVEGGAKQPSRGQSAWISGALAASQAAVLTLALLVMPAVAAFVATSADPSNAGTSWFESVRVACGLWLLGHGVPLAAGDATVTLVPLGLTLVLTFACYASARRTSQAARSAYASGVVTYAVIGLLVALVAGSAPGPAVLLAPLGTAAVAAVGLGSGIRRPGGSLLREAWTRLATRLPSIVRLGMRAGAAAAALVTVAASVLAVSWIVLGRSASADVIRGLGVEGLDAAVLAVAQSLFAANLVVWGAAWLSGPGFAVGAGSHFAPTEVVGGPLPTVPLVGALPDPSTVTALTPFAPVVIVLCGMLCALFVLRARRSPTWRDVLAGAGVLAVVAGLLVAVAVALASGAIGPGRMATVGASPLVVGGAVALLTGGGALVVLTVRNPAVRALARRYLDPRAWWRSRAETGSSDSGRGGPASGSREPVPGEPRSGVPGRRDLGPVPAPPSAD